MVPKNRHRFTLAIVEVTSTSMVLEHQITDEPEEVGDDPEAEIDHFRSAEVLLIVVALIPN